MPNIIIPDKICPCCNGNKWYKRIRGDKIYYECYACMRKVQRTYANTPKGKLIQKNWDQSEAGKTSHKKYESSEKGRKNRINTSKRFRQKMLKNNKKEWNRRNNQYHKTARIKLKNVYIKRLIHLVSKVKFSDITEKHVKIHKKRLCLKRTIQQKKLAQKQQPLEINSIANLKKAI